MKLKKNYLKATKVLSEDELKLINGGSPIDVLCYIGKRCERSVQVGTVYYTRKGTCSGDSLNGGVSCFCDVGTNDDHYSVFQPDCTRQ